MYSRGHELCTAQPQHSAQRVGLGHSVGSDLRAALIHFELFQHERLDPGYLLGQAKLVWNTRVETVLKTVHNSRSLLYLFLITHELKR